MIKGTNHAVIQQIAYTRLRTSVTIHRVMLDRLLNDAPFPSQELVELLAYLANTYNEAASSLRILRELELRSDADWPPEPDIR